MLGDVGRGATVLSAERQPLEQAQEDQDGRSRPADGLERGQQTDREGREAHDHDRDEECVLATDEVADAAEEQRTERTHEEPSGVRTQRAHELRRGIHLWKEQTCKEGCENCVKVEVVPLENGAERRGYNDLSHLGLRYDVVCAEIFGGSAAVVHCVLSSEHGLRLHFSARDLVETRNLRIDSRHSTCVWTASEESHTKIARCDPESS